MRRLAMMALAAASAAAVFGAEIRYAADGTTGEYCGKGYSVNVNVSSPKSGYTIKYSESATGPWTDELSYVDVCSAKPIYFQITADGYDTVVDSKPVTVTPKPLTGDYVWLVLPWEDYVYDGTAKTPEGSCSDGDPSLITEDDFTLTFENNVHAGTATATFTGRGNYAGTVTEDFAILKAENAWTTEPSVADWTYGASPSTPKSAAKSGTARVTWSSGERPTLPGSYTATFTVPESSDYRALTKTVAFKINPAAIRYVADGASGEYCGAGFGVNVSVSSPKTGYTVKYSEAETGPWLDQLSYVDVCTAKLLYFQISAEGYGTVVGSKPITVTPKTLTSDYVWLVLPWEDYVYDGMAKMPETACGDGEPSLIGFDDFTMSVKNNVNAGTATATFIGKGNYVGVVTEDFDILARALEETMVGEIGLQNYTGSEIKPEPTVGDAVIGKQMVKGTDYILAWSDNVNAGVATVTVTGKGNYSGTIVRQFRIKAEREDEVIGIIGDGGTVAYTNGTWYVTITNSPAGPFTFPDDLGEVVLDLHGCDIFGTPGEAGTESVPGGNGGPAIRIRATGNTDAPTQFRIVDSIPDDTDDIIGGDGGAGNPGGNGGPGILVDPTCAEGTKVYLGKSVGVRGGKGGKDLGGGADGEDGLPIDGPFDIGEGTVVPVKVRAPSIASKEATGELLEADVPADPRWNVTRNKGGTAAGVYDVCLTLVDPICYEWKVEEGLDVQGANVFLEFVITEAPAVPIEGGNVDPLGGSSINYSGVYDGLSHGISVILRDPRPAGAKVLYARSAQGPFTETNPQFVNACQETVWYLVTADDYEPSTNSATVTVSAKALLPTYLKAKGLRENSAGEIVPALFFEDDPPCQITDEDWEVASWIPRNSGGGTAEVRGCGNYAGTLMVDIGNEMVVLFDAVYGETQQGLRTYVTQVPGEKYVLPVAPRVRGLRFVGWFTAREGGEEVTAQSIVKLSNSDTLYAHWRAESYLVAFDVGDGVCDECTEEMEVEWGGSFGKLPKPTRQGYTFGGWYGSPDYANDTLVRAGDAAPGGDLTLYAKWNRRRLWYTEYAFNLAGAETYQGYLLDANEIVVGTIELKVGKPNKGGVSKVTATIQVAGAKKEKLKGTTFDGIFAGTTKDGRKVDMRIGANGCRGTFANYEIDAARNVFRSKDADAKIVAAQALRRWQGAYVLSIGTENGYAGISLEVRNKGAVKVAGVLPDGNRLSGKAQLLVGERECAIAFSYTKKESSIAFLVWLCEDGSVECSNLTDPSWNVKVAAAKAGPYLNSGACFHVDGEAMAAKTRLPLQIGLLPEGVAVNMANNRFTVPKAGKVKLLKDKSGIDPAKLGDNPSGLKLSYTLRNCSFKGSFTAYAIIDGKLKKYKASVTGVVLRSVGYGMATIKGLGSFPVTIE